MKVILIDPFSGAAGDMIIGALLDCGADRGLVAAAMASVVAEPSVSRVMRCGIAATRIETRAGPAHRTIDEVLAILESCAAPDPVREMARSVFMRLHRAEARVHGDESVHFHEVGADDAVADVVGACTALWSLGVDGVTVRPVTLGSGTGGSAHGRIPYPSPATVAVLEEAGIPVVFADTGHELCTPTGAALLAEFATLAPGEVGEARLRSTGYGAGSRDPPDRPNVLRVMVLEPGGGMNEGGDVDVLETNVDDVTAEVLSYTLGRLMDGGARDASAAPLMMKKGRMGYLVRVIADPADSRRLAGLMAVELGTLGVRLISSVHRIRLTRTVLSTGVAVGGRTFPVDVKVGWHENAPLTFKAEYEQARAAAEATGVPLREVARMAEEQARARIDEERTRR